MVLCTPQPLRHLLRSAFLAGFAALALPPVAHAQCDRWDPLGSRGINATHARVAALTSWDPDAGGPLNPCLVAAGAFTIIGGRQANNIAMRDGTAWEPLGPGLDDAVRSLTTWDEDADGPLPARLIAAGRFLNAGKVPATRIAMWDGTAWRPLGPGVNGTVASVCTWDADGPGPAAPLLVAAGAFSEAGEAPANRVAAWNGTHWRSLGMPFVTGPSTVRMVTSWDSDGTGPALPELVAVGSFRTDAPPFFCSAARRDATAWSPMCCLSCTQGSVYAVASWPGQTHESLYMAASWPPDDIVRWDRGTLVGFAPILSGYPAQALVPWDPDDAGPLEPQIVVGGGYAWFANGAPLNGIARFDGTWHPFGAGMEYTLSLGGLSALCTWDPDGPGPATDILVAGGSFGPSETPSDRYLVAAWLVGAPTITTQPSAAHAPPGSDARVTVGASGENLAYQWLKDGLPLADGPTGHGSVVEGATSAALLIRAFATSDAGSYRVVVRNQCGETPSAGAIITSCRPDFNFDHHVDSRDFFEFVTAFFDADPRADFDLDTVVTDLDFFAFLQAFLTGCDD